MRELLVDKFLTLWHQFPLATASYRVVDVVWPLPPLLSYCRDSIRRMVGHLSHAHTLASSSSLLCTSTQHKELTWLLKVAWNLALKCEHHHKEMAQLFSLCHQLCAMLPVQVAILKRQKSCQLMAAAAMLQVARATEDSKEKVSWYTDR